MVPGSSLGSATPLAGLVALGLLSACDPTTVEKLDAKLSHPEVLDFGRVAVGGSRTMSLPLAAVGSRPIRDVSVTAPDPVNVGLVPDIAAGSVFELPVSFAPNQPGPLMGSLELATGHGETYRVELRGEAVSDGVFLMPASLDFGAVRLGDVRPMELRLISTLDHEVQLRLPSHSDGTLRFTGDGDSFSLEAEPMQSRTQVLPPRGEVRWRFGFAPFRVGEMRARLELESCDRRSCVGGIDFRGAGVQVGLRCAPAELDFGSVRPDGQRRLDLTCDNPTHRPLRLDPPFTVGGQADRFEALTVPSFIPAGGSGTLPVEVRPQSSDRGNPIATTLIVDGRSGIGGVERVRIALKALVARAELQALPMALPFGRVAVGVEAERKVVIMNVGDRPVDVLGASVGAPFVLTGASRRQLAPGEPLVLSVRVYATREADLAAELVVEVDDPEVANLVVPVSAYAIELPPCELDVEATQLDFGLVNVRTVGERSLVVTNRASTDCLIREVRTEGDGFSPANWTGTDIVVGGGERARLDVRFQPTESGESLGRLQFKVSDPARPDREVGLAAVAGLDQLWIDPPVIDFGPLRPGCGSRTRLLRILNMGSASMQVSEADVQGMGFSLVDPPPGVPSPPGTGFSLRAGEFLEVQVGFTTSNEGPVVPGSFNVSRAGMPAPRAVPLLGEGVGDDASEHFEQTAAGLVDVLFVFDNSLSMESEQRGAIANAGRFLQHLSDAQADYRVAVVSTDTADTSCATPAGSPRPSDAPQGACGWFADAGRADWRVIDPSDTPTPAEAFARVLDLGLGGSATEAGLGAAARALSAPALAGHNQGFLRPGAQLAVVFVSDEEDQSSGLTETYLARLRQAAPTGSSVSAVITTGTCLSETGYRYRDLAEATGGLITSICSTDWADTMVRLADRALGRRSSLPLAGDPQPGTISVWVEGVELSEDVGTGRGWSYDRNQRQIRFARNSVPRFGASIEVRYRPSCP